MTPVHDDHIRTLLKRPAVNVHHEATLRSVAETFAEESIGAAVVKETNPPGIVSERDIVRAPPRTGLGRRRDSQRLQRQAEAGVRVLLCELAAAIEQDDSPWLPPG